MTTHAVQSFNTSFMSIKKSVLKLATILLLLAGSSYVCGTYILASDSTSNDKPNIILIFADDLGYSDVSCYGAEYGNTFTETPNLDRLASEGMKFTNAYASAPICSPSRAALLTGKSPARLRFEFVTKYEGETFSWDSASWKMKFEDRELTCPPYTTTLPLEEETIAERLKENGYTTGMVGKWHVAPHHKKYQGWSLTHGPDHQGFDWTAESFGAHTYGYSKNDKKKDYKKGEYPDDELTNKAIEFIGMEHQEPFFLFASHYFVHTPIDSRLDWLIDKYKKKSLKSNEDVPERVIQYAAFVDRLDHYVGQLLDAIDEKGLAENTLVIFTSDNGGHPSFAFNRPFRGSKWNLYEGGVREPFIVRWPGVVEKGTICDAPVVQMDLLPTFTEICGNVNNPISEIDGISILPLFKGEVKHEIEDRTLVWHFPYYHPEGGEYDKAIDEIGIEDRAVSKTTPQSSIRKGNYKLIYFYDSNKVELYDLGKDIQERNDLSKSRPWDANKLESELFMYLNKVNARFPRRNIVFPQ
jgi:arylsulfatase A-like enzyme